MTGEIQPLRPGALDEAADRLLLRTSYRIGHGREYRRLARQAETGLFMTDLGALLQALRMSNAFKLYKLRVDMTIAVGEILGQRLTETDNPLTQAALIEAFENWTQLAKQIVGAGGGW